VKQERKFVTENGHSFADARLKKKPPPEGSG